VTAGLVTFSTHVLDATTGRPAAGIGVRLERSRADGGWTPTAEGQADADGRLRLPNGLEPNDLEPGVYRVTFGTGRRAVRRSRVRWVKLADGWGRGR